MAELTYTKVGDYYIPDLILDGEPEPDVFYGTYGSLRRGFPCREAAKNLLSIR